MINKQQTLVVIRTSDMPTPVPKSTKRKCDMCGSMCWIGPTPNKAQPPYVVCTYCFAAMEANRTRRDGK